MSERILVIKLGALGDFIYALGAMRAIRNHHPDAHITLLTRKPYESLARQTALFDEILLDPKPKLNLLHWLSFRKILNGLGVSRVYDLQNNDRSEKYFKLFSPKPEWVGIAKGASHRNTDPDRSRYHSFPSHQKTLSLVGIEDVRLDTLDWLKGDLRQFGATQPYALLVPGSSPQHPEKRWPVTYYRALTEKLISCGVQPVFIGTISEKSLIAEISDGLDILDLSGRTEIGDIAALARSASCAIGNDTGPMHIISMTGCPCLMFFCTSKSWIEKHGPQISTSQALETDDLSKIQVTQAWQIVESILRRQF